MKNEKILEGIEPFNEIFQNCFYSSIIPAVKYYQYSIAPLLVNEVFTYKYERESDRLGLALECNVRYDVNQILAEQGIIMNVILRSDQIIEDIIESLSNDMPCLLWIDCFYSSIRKDTYLKMHLPHSLLIYGFNKEKEELNIIEHNHFEHILFEKKTISFQDVERSYQEYLDRYYEEGGGSFFSVSVSEEPYIAPSSAEMLEALKLHENYFQETLKAGWNDLKLFIEEFINISQNDELLLANIENLVGMMNDIVIAKQVENYRNALVAEATSPYVTIHTEILNHWIAIRGTLAKIMYSSKINTKSLENAIHKLKLIHELEQTYHRHFFI